MTWDRVALLGEDVAHRQFLRRICEKLGWKIVDEAFSPRGHGAASGWVIQQLPERLNEIRASPGLGLLVALDGDNVGRAGRQAALHRACEALNVGPVQDKDAVAVLVPTWSLDTWILYFHKDLVVPEHTKSKRKAARLFDYPQGYRAPGVPVEHAPRLLKARPLESLASGFLSTRADALLPSINSSREDLRRWTD